MKRAVVMAALAGTFSAGAITVQNAGNATVVRGNDGTVVVNTAAPKYSLNEAIELCIRELEQRGEKVTSGTVKNRLQRMPRSDVDLNVKGLSRTVSEVIEAHEARKAKESPAPDPAKYDKREKFVAAYVDWKMSGLTKAERDDLHGRMGAETKFKRTAKDEADKLWQAQNKPAAK